MSLSSGALPSAEGRGESHRLQGLQQVVCVPRCRDTQHDVRRVSAGQGGLVSGQYCFIVLHTKATTIA